MPEEEQSFEDLFDEDLGLSGAVGEGEIYLRKQMGNERFDKLIEFQDISAGNSVAFDEANVRRMNGIADAWENLNKLLGLILGRISK